MIKLGENMAAPEPPRKVKACHMYQKTSYDLTHRLQPLLDNSPR